VILLPPITMPLSLWQGNCKWLARGHPISGNQAAPLSRGTEAPRAAVPNFGTIAPPVRLTLDVKGVSQRARENDAGAAQG
jgi:hypothetical protein